MAASGGYYISTNCEKIFAQPTTLTGSIGVFGVKFDASEWAKSYGIRGDYHPHGSHGAALHPLTPLTPGMNENLTRMMLGYYDYFKSIVATGRSLSIDDVEEIAQGRVWTGEQAKEVGLVDALGGLDRAITYAKKSHTKSDLVDIVYFPRKTSIFEELQQLSSEQVSYRTFVRELLTVTVGLEGCGKSGLVDKFLANLADLKFAQKPHFMFAMDEKTAIELIVMGE